MKINISGNTFHPGSKIIGSYNVFGPYDGRGVPQPQKHTRSSEADKEFDYMAAFATNRESSLDEPACRSQFLALWTSYCLHHNLEVDTAAYDAALLRLWNMMSIMGASKWPNFDSFDIFMCQFLV